MCSSVLIIQRLLTTLYNRDLLWSSPSDLYPIMVQILKIPEYRLELLTGLIASAGGLTESLVILYYIQS
jgi:hypothetical protein